MIFLKFLIVTLFWINCIAGFRTQDLRIASNDVWETEEEYDGGGFHRGTASVDSTLPPIAIFQAHFSSEHSGQPSVHPFPFRTASLSQTNAELDVLNQYNGSLSEAPPTEKGEPIKVNMSVLILQVRDIKELTEEVTLEMNIRMYWKDSRLQSLVTAGGPDEDGRPKKFAAISLKFLDRLWYPDIFLDHVKSISQPSVITRPASLRVYSDSTVRYSARFTIVMSCPMDFHMYPADTQKCSVNIKSYAFTNKILDLKWTEDRGAFLVDKLVLPNFEVGLDLPENFMVTTTSGNYSGVRFTVLLHRKLSYHLLQTYFPSNMLVTISWLGYLVQPESVPARMTLSMTTLLTLVSMFSSIRQSIPSVSYIKALDVYMVFCVVFVKVTLIEYAIVLKLISLKKVPKKCKETGPSSSLVIANHQYVQNIASTATAPAGMGLVGAPATSTAGSAGTGDQQIPTISKGNSEFTDPTRKHYFGLRPSSTTPMQLLNVQMMEKSEAEERQIYYERLVCRIEFLSSILIPTSFVVFNLIYWPWLLRALEYVEDVTEYYHL